MSARRSLLLGLWIAMMGLSMQVPVVWGEESAAALAEKEKAMKNPYPNDFGWDKVDVSKYTANQKAGYKLLQVKCGQCHSPARVLNSQFVELKAEEMAAMKKSHPEVFKDKKVWQVEDKIWKRYVRRMMAKPGCDIESEDGKKIWQFVVAYSEKEKVGKAAASWGKHRRKLLADFKEKYPERYKELFESE